MERDAETAVQGLLARLRTHGIDAEIVTSAEWTAAVTENPERFLALTWARKRAGRVGDLPIFDDDASTAVPKGTRRSHHANHAVKQVVSY
jgi:hypothetical protein